MSSRVATLRDEVHEIVRALDPARMDGRDAAASAEIFAELERLGSAGKTLTARRVRDCGTWARHGDRSFEAWLARISGTGLGEAIRVADTAARLEELPATEAALRDGRLSRVQADEVAAAAAVDPDAEPAMLHAAESGTVKALKERGKQVKATRRDEADRYARIKADRHVRTWEDHDGAHLHMQSTADDVAIVKTAIEAYEPAIFERARTADEPESHGAYRADALVAIARDALSGTTTQDRKRLPRAELRIRLDFPAFRGHTEPGEKCQIPGIGPIPVEVARALVPDAILDLVLTQGQDVRAIVTHSRTVRRAVQVALEERYPTCAKWDCDVATHLDATTYATSPTPDTPATTSSSPGASTTTTSRPIAATNPSSSTTASGTSNRPMPTRPSTTARRLTPRSAEVRERCTDTLVVPTGCGAVW